MTAATRPRLLDLFCGAGGAAMGYHRAGFDVVGVDIAPQPNYPFPFIQADALNPPVDLADFDAVHASPPCQAYSVTGRAFPHLIAKRYPRLIEPTRDLLQASTRPYIIENVEGSPLTATVVLCGSMFGLSAYDPDMGRIMYLKRHRLFETDFPMLSPPDMCKQYAGSIAGVYGGGGIERAQAIKGQTRRGGYTPKADVRRELMQMPWATMKETNEAIPPAYTEWVGSRLLEYVRTNMRSERL